ncbi:MAG TPA: Mur ligase family protein, partial [Candidatus Dojkabacteria bacterium]|nr:Mur ligase family protein [Candidatus Dojkabacteria bacterium]
MSAFHLLIIFFWLPSILVLKRNVLAAVYLYQTKEFRFDRVLSHYRNEQRLTKSQQIMVFVKIGIFTGLVIYLLVPAAAVLLISLPVVFIVYLNEGILFLESVIAKRFLRPSLRNIRNLLLIVFSILLLLLPLAALLTLPDILAAPEGTLYQGFTVKNPVDSYDLAALLPQEIEGVLVIPLVMVALVFSALFVLAADNLSFLAVTLGVVLTEPLAQIRRYILIIKARNKISWYPKIKVIGITGSYGKSTTKELIYQLVRQKFTAVVTPKNYNTAVGIAAVILKQVKKSTEVFIAEMGAYTKGEVAQSAKLVPPDIAIITGIEEQHLSLFGSIENILQAKYEIIEYMRPDGLAIFNGDNEYCLRLAEKTTQRKKIYFTVNDYDQIMTQTIASGELEDGKTQFPINENTYARDLVLTRKGINFDLHFQG